MKKINKISSYFVGFFRLKIPSTYSIYDIYWRKYELILWNSKFIRISLQRFECVFPLYNLKTNLSLSHSCQASVKYMKDPSSVDMNNNNKIPTIAHLCGSHKSPQSYLVWSDLQLSSPSRTNLITGTFRTLYMSIWRKALYFTIK